MKGFLATVCIFVLILGIILTNKIYLTNASTDLLQQAKDLQESIPNSVDRIERFQKDWESNKDLLQVSVSHKRIDTVTDLIDALLCYARMQDETEYQKTAVLLVNALEEIKRFEEFSAVNIL